MDTVSVPASFVLSFFKNTQKGFVTDTGALGDAWESDEAVTLAMISFKNHVEFYYSGNISEMDLDSLVDAIKTIITAGRTSLQTLALEVPMATPITTCVCVRRFTRAGSMVAAHAGARAALRVHARGKKFVQTYLDAYDNACFKECLRSVKRACGPICRQDCIRICVHLTYKAHHMLMSKPMKM